MKEINVLFTAVSGWPTHATIGALRNSPFAKYTIIGVDCKPNVASLNYVDFLYKVPRCNAPDYVDALLDICKKHNVDVIVPLISEDIHPLSENREKIEGLGIKLLMSGPDSLVDIANDKFLLQQFLLEHDMDVMPMTKLVNLETIDEDLIAFGYPDTPIAVKMKDGCGAVGFKILDEKRAKNVNGLSSRENRANPYITKEQLLHLPQIERYMLQEYLPGSECGALCLVDHGKTVYSVSHEDYEMAYAVTTDCELVENEEMTKIVTEVNRLLKLDGNIGYDFKRDAHGRIRLLECNPRISATVCLPVKAGLNIVEFGIRHALGYPIPEGIIPLYGLRMQRVYGTLYTCNGEPYGC